MRAHYASIVHNPAAPTMKLYAHQQEFFDLFKDSEGFGLFFEMGCGKTLTLLKLAEYKFQQKKINGLLVIAPNDVHMQWYQDLVSGVNKNGVIWQELSIDYDVQCVGGRGGQKELIEFRNPDKFQILIVNVETASVNSSISSKWQSIVEWVNKNQYMIAVDEATVIKNPDSTRGQRILYDFNKVVKRRSTILSSEKICPYRAVLTGTPVTNSPTDLWAIMEFVKPNFFNRGRYSFQARYGMYTQLSVDTGGRERVVNVPLTPKTWQGIKDCEDFEKASAIFGCSQDTYLTVKSQDKFLGAYKHADELRELLKPCCMFKKLTDCVDMPAVNYITRNVGMSDEQARVYKDMQQSMLALYGAYSTDARNKMTAVMRLQQISSGFIMAKKVDFDFSDEDSFDNQDVMPDEVVWLGKSCPRLDALMRDIDEVDKPVLILTRFTAEAAKIYELCEKKYRTGLFTGWKVTNGGVTAFKEGKLDILVANSAKVSRGFNLQNSHTTLFYSNSFSMEIRQQAEFRTFRMGQKEACLYIDYIASDADRTVYSALVQKKGLLEAIRNQKMGDIINGSNQD